MGWSRSTKCLGVVSVAMVVGAAVPAAARPHPPGHATSIAASDGIEVASCDFEVFEDNARRIPEASVLGSPRRSVAGVRRAGVVELRQRRVWQVTSSRVGRKLQPDGLFGFSTAVEYVTPLDSCPDLVIGVPGWSKGRGAVVIVPDFGKGLDLRAAIWLPTSKPVLRAGDRLGTSVGVVPGDGTAGAVVVAGAPGRDVTGVKDSGMLVLWRFPPVKGSATRLRPAAPVALAQGHGLADKAEPGDMFGSVIASPSGPAPEQRIVLGVPDEDVGAVTDAGAVARLTFANSRVVDDDLVWLGHGLPLAPASQDRLGAAVTQEPDAYGVPGLNSHGIKDAGAVLLPQRAPRKARVVTENSPGVPGTAQRGDRFGTALAALWLDTSVDGGPFLQGVAVGIPGQDVGKARDAGAAVLVAGQLAEWHGDGASAASATVPVKGLAAGDGFGSRLTVVRSEADDDLKWDEDLLIGAPGEDRPRATNAGRYYQWIGFEDRYDEAPTKRPARVEANGVTRSEQLGG